MKKLLLVLTAIALLLLLGSTALADGVPCDQCGGSTTLLSTGSWCHWYCEACDRTTSRNHDPNSSYSGLVPDSCSGSCRWCGAAANFSSHTFESWTYNNDATCLKDGTETSMCGNVSCSATSNRSVAGTALGHDYAAEALIAPTCEEKGLNKLTCKRCSYVTEETASALSHYYGPWSSNGDGTHTARCERSGCRKVLTSDCTLFETVTGGVSISICPVCGYTSSKSGTGLKPVESFTVKTEDDSPLPGRMTMLIDAAPLEVEIPEPAFYMLTAILQRSGKAIEPTTRMEITVNLNKHPFEVEGVHAGKTPADLTAADVRFVRVITTVAEDGTVTEEWRDVPFTLEKGKLVFKTEKMGVYLLLERVAQ